MNKSLMVINLVFNFELIEEQGIWYLGKNEFDIFKLGYSTDITINESTLNWNEIEGFLKSLLRDINEIHYKLNISNESLKKIFKKSFYRVIPDFKYDDIFFTLCNIEYLGQNETKNGFKYILNFNVESRSDPDFFTYDSWKVVFNNEFLIDAYKT